MTYKHFKKTVVLPAATALLALIALIFVTSCGSNEPETTNGTTASETAKETTAVSVIDRFNEPDAMAKPMARMWFPDAGAGEDPNDLIEKQILELAEKGFGGVEVAMLADGVSYDNAGGKAYGWGTENWSKLLRKVLKAAAKVPGGFQVDMTITAHWPPTLNTLDPNDEAANKEISYSLTKITSKDLAGGRISLQLPQQKTDGPSGGFGGRGAYEHFLFTDTFISATIAQVSEIKMVAEKAASPFPMPGAARPGAAEPVMTPRYVFDFGTLKTITADVTATAEGGYAAGVPDRATAEARGWNYDDICEFFGPESDGPWVSDNGKLDAESNRKRMADWQDQYTADLTDVTMEGLDNGADIQPGDWVVVSTFYRGTGQSIPGGRIMHNGVFVTNYFNEAGTKVVTDFWDNMLANDPELLELMKANKGYIFEDSIESSSVSSYWASTLLDDVPDDYAYKGILPLVAASQYLSSGFMGTTLTDFFEFEGDNGLASRIYEDYCDTLAGLYVRYRVSGMVKWAESALGWGFRGQTYHLPGLEISRAAMVADVAECDNMSKGDGVRYQAGTVNITGRDFLTMEAITGPSIGYVTMDDVITEVGQNYSDGVNRVILHGTPYAKTFNGYNSDWPGWLPFGPSSFGSAYTYRQAYWDDVPTETAYMARIQAVLQEGDARIDLAVLIDKKHTFDFESGNRFQNLLDAGFSYNLISEATMSAEDAVVAGGRLAPDGPAYKALIVDEVSILSLAGMEKLIGYAENGLPVVVYKSDIGRVYGSKVEDDATVKEKFAELLGMENVMTAASLDELEAALTELGTTPYARYSVPQLETTLYRDTADGTNYYYIFNNAYPENSGMMGNNQGAFYKGEDKVVKKAVITLAGDGVPYKLDPHSGQISQVGAYAINGDGSVTFEIDELAGGDGVIYAIAKDMGAFPAEDVYVTGASQPTDAYAIVRTADGLALRSNTPGEYAVKLSDGTMKTVTVAETLDAVDLSGEKWELTIKSYGPAEDPNDPSESKVTAVDFGAQMLGKWKDLPATARQLAELGVDNIRNVSGIGEYTITFTTPASWSETTGAFLDVAYGMDQIGSCTVNGVTIPANNASDRVDLGGLLVPGQNTITVKLSTSLYGRMFVENSGYANKEFGMSGGFMAPTDPDAYYNGLLKVTLTPYTQISLGTNKATEVSVIDRFNEPDAIAKPMARMWFGDASAGVDDNDTIAKQIDALADAGYGGVEVAMLADDSNYTNAQAEYGGWGTPSWVSLLKKIYTAANAVEGGFIVDLTITSHWPPCLNTIDPNDDAASQEFSVAMTKVTADMLAAGTARLKLPETRTADSHSAHFIFTDRLTSAAAAKVTGIEGETVVVDFTTLTTLGTEKMTVDDVSGLQPGTYKMIDGAYYLGSAAGVPDEETCEKYGWTYSSEEEDGKWLTLSKSTVGVFGKAPEAGADLSASYNGKEDDSFNRARMADWQYRYAADVSGLGISGANNSPDIAVGDWVIVGVFCRGTGQMYSGRNGEENKQPTMLNRPYVSNYFDSVGIDVVADYWAKYILSDTELAEMMKVNGAMGASIFEDSIEASSETNFWVFDILDEIEAHYGPDYEYADQLPIVVSGYTDNEAGGPMMMGFESQQKTDVLEFSNVDASVVKRIEQDYFSLMGTLYNEQHCHVSNKWAESIGYSYRAQTYSLTGMDIAAAAASVTIPEGESGQNGDGHRQMRSAVNLYDKQCLSMEAITGAKIYDFNWEDVLFALTSNFSYGINHVIMHGSAYSKSLNGAGADWPGWDPFRGSFGEPYTYRQIYWDAMPLVTDYVARIQAIMQIGTAKVDVAVLVDDTAVFSSGRGNTFPTLLDNGFSYNILSESLLFSENAQKTAGQVIYADGPAYKAIVLENINCLSAKGMAQLIKYAKDGIRIVSMNSSPAFVYGTEKGNETGANVAALYRQLLEYDCVTECKSEDQLVDALHKLGISSYAQYEIDGLEASLYQDDIDGSNYYYLYNDTGITAGMLTAASAKKYKVDPAYNRALTDEVIRLKGTGTPYFLDPLTGKIEQAGEYVDNGDGTVSLVLDKLNAACCKIVVITENDAKFPTPDVFVASVNAGKADYDIVRVDGKMMLRSAVAGDYVVTLSNGEEKTVTISENGKTADLSNSEIGLLIDSYGPTYPNASDMVDERGIQTVDPSATTVTAVDFGTMPLNNWEAISATPEQLSQMGVTSMKEVSGKGYYSLTFDWDGSGAYLMLAYGNDQVTGIAVNGTEVAAIDNMTDKIDLGGMLEAGKNTLEIELSSTLAGRATVESDVLSDGGLNFGGTTYKNNGLSSIKLVSYEDASI